MEQSHRFCRRCGNPSNLEVETRDLEQPQPLPVTTEPVGKGQTSPAVFTPGAMFGAPIQAPPMATSPVRSRTPLIVAGVLVGILFLILIAVGGFFFVNMEHAGPVVPAVTAPPAPGAPAAPQIPDVPPPPEPPPLTAKDVPVDSSLRYPGAQVLMSNSTDRGQVLTMRTQASAETVVRWYEARLRVSKKVVLPGSAILKGDGTAVVINTDAHGTSIVVRQGPDE